MLFDELIISPQSVCRRIMATRISETVFHRISDSGGGGEVVSIFNGAFNIKTFDGFLVHLAIDEKPLTPRSVLFQKKDFWAAGVDHIRAGMNVLFHNQYIFIPDIRLQICAESAVKFNPRFTLNAKIIPHFQIMKNLLVALKWIEDEIRQEQITRISPLSGYFLSKLQSNPNISCQNEKSQRPNQVFPLMEKWKNNLWDCIDSLLCNLESRCIEKIQNSVLKILGNGPGLTPSGDDFLAGFIVTGVVFGRLFNRIDELIDTVVQIVYSAFVGRTTDVSGAMIEDACNGQVSEPVEDLMQSILTGDTVDRIVLFARKIHSIGAYSGEDLLNGLATGICFWGQMAGPKTALS
ncbi:MAG: DUF2877 domain-containing protein [Thermodesulfobacteriota bacterium]